MTNKQKKKSNEKINQEKKSGCTLCFRHVVYTLLFSVLFLFYPGDSYYVKTFFYNRELFAASNTTLDTTIKDTPYVINTFYKPDISAQGAYVIGLTTASPIFQKNKHEKYYPASTTKVITALAAFDYFKLDDVLTVKNIIEEGQNVDFVLGEKLTFENLLYALLVHSGNDAAYVIADNYKGGREAFIDAMNKKAKELSMKNSHFTNPAGYDDTNQYTTPFDLALAGRKLLENKTLAKIVSIKAITISDVDFSYSHALSNTNKLLGDIPGIGGLKTGYTQDAKENLVTFYKKNNHKILIVILKSNDRFEDTKQIITWIDTNIGFFTGLKK